MMFKRNCETCSKEMLYKNEITYNICSKRNTKCKSCSAIERMSKRDMFGDNNPFYGKKHSKETIERIIKNQPNLGKTLPIELIEKLKVSNTGKNNPMYGKSVYDIWVQKYGKKEADIKWNNKKTKASKQMSGSGNNMYGKPTPKKAGNGWCGWYKDWFFRSLRELSYVINVIEKDGSSWISGEIIHIKYVDYKGNDRTYSPDFIVDNKYMVEIKPVRLHDSVNVKLKQQSAMEYCNKNNLEYKLLDIQVIDIKEIELLLISKTVVFTDKTNKRYLLYKENNG